MQIFVNSVERLNSLVYSAPPCILEIQIITIFSDQRPTELELSLVIVALVLLVSGCGTVYCFTTTEH